MDELQAHQLLIELGRIAKSMEILADAFNHLIVYHKEFGGTIIPTLDVGREVK